MGDKVTLSQAQPNVLTASLKFLRDPSVPSLYVASVGGGDSTAHHGDYIQQSVTLHNARHRADALSLDREGFVLRPQTSAVTDFYDDVQIQSLYEAEVSELVMAETGARRVAIFDHTRRSSSVEVQKAQGIRESARIVHNDYTARSGPNRLRDYYARAPEKFDALMQRRFAIVNVWRSMRGTVQNAPMAFCDAQTMPEQCVVSVTRQARDRMGEIQMATHHGDQRWHYFEAQTAQEALLFKTYDSAEDGRTRFVLHTAFDHPAATSETPARESIETRCFVFF